MVTFSRLHLHSSGISSWFKASECCINWTNPCHLIWSGLEVNASNGAKSVSTSFPLKVLFLALAGVEMTTWHVGGIWHFLSIHFWRWNKQKSFQNLTYFYQNWIWIVCCAPQNSMKAFLRSGLLNGSLSQILPPRRALRIWFLCDSSSPNWVFLLFVMPWVSGNGLKWCSISRDSVFISSPLLPASGNGMACIWWHVCDKILHDVFCQGQSCTWDALSFSPNPIHEFLRFLLFSLVFIKRA